MALSDTSFYLRSPATSSPPVGHNIILQNLITDMDDTFELYDLRVEVICPPGAKIMCGAKEGDHFTLEGELMHLPPGQGFSIYSLGLYFSSLFLPPMHL